MPAVLQRVETGFKTACFGHLPKPQIVKWYEGLAPSRACFQARPAGVRWIAETLLHAD